MLTFSSIKLLPEELEELEDLEEFIYSFNLNPLFTLGMDDFYIEMSPSFIFILFLSIFKDNLYKLPELREIFSSITL
jgi:hypothetical protein